MTALFVLILLLVIVQRLYELRIANRNFAQLQSKGGVEFGGDHYGAMIAMHTLFFLSLIAESVIIGIKPPFLWPLFFLIVLVSQIGRVWVIHAMRGRWTTRVIVVQGEKLVGRGPYRFMSHPNYVIVALEIAAIPLIFGLYYTAAVFTVLNALMLLGIRLPVERRALEWSQEPQR